MQRTTAAPPAAASTTPGGSSGRSLECHECGNCAFGCGGALSFGIMMMMIMIKAFRVVTTWIRYCGRMTIIMSASFVPWWLGTTTTTTTTLITTFSSSRRTLRQCCLDSAASTMLIIPFVPEFPFGSAWKTIVARRSTFRSYSTSFAYFIFNFRASLYVYK